MTTQTYDNPSIGCYFDGAHGQSYNDMRVLKLALSYGWQDEDGKRLADPDIDDTTGNPDYSDDDQDILSDVVDDAIEYLNSLETRSFLSWQWYDGDFGLYPDVGSAREDCGFVSWKTLADAGRAGVLTDPEDSTYPPADYEGEWLHVTDHGNATLYVRQNGQDKEIWSCV